MNLLQEESLFFLRNQKKHEKIKKQAEKLLIKFRNSEKMVKKMANRINNYSVE